MSAGGLAAGCFVTGTDTGVGKTVVACAVVRALRARGIAVAVRKPIETGVGPDGPRDAEALRAAAAASEPIATICPVALPLPAAPAVAAAHAGVRLDLDEIVRAVRAAGAGGAFVVAEGAGGLLVPIAPGFDMADLARACGLPLLLVARSRLGTVSHTRLSLEAAVARGLRVAGVVISHVDGRLSDADARNLAWLRDALGALVLGEIPPLAPGAIPDAGAIDVDALLARCASPPAAHAGKRR